MRSRGDGVRTRLLRHGSVGGTPERIRGVCGVDAKGRALLGLGLDGELVASATNDGSDREFTAFGLHLLARRAGARVTFAEVRAATVRSEEVVTAKEGSGAFDGRRRALRRRATCEPRRGRTAVTLSVDGTRVAQARRAGGPPAFGVVGFCVHGEPGGSEVEFDNVRVVTIGE